MSKLPAPHPHYKEKIERLEGMLRRSLLLLREQGYDTLSPAASPWAALLEDIEDELE